MIATQTYGMTPKEIGLMTISELKPYEIAYNKQKEMHVKEIEYSAWLYGAYTKVAIDCSNIANSSWFHGKSDPNKYPDKPYSESNNTEKHENIDEEDSEYFAMLKMRSQIAKWERQGLPKAPD